jgi:hypothetical protein
MGIYPLLNAASQFVEKANLRLMQNLLSRINLSKRPVTIGLTSMQNGEGKSTIIDLWHKDLTNLKYKVEKLQWKENMEPFATDTDIVLVEFPPFDIMMIKPNMLPKLDISILVCRANRIWGKIDKDLLTIFTKTTGNRPELLLNGVKTDFAEEYVGEVQKKRSSFRKFIKGLVKFEFGNQKKIK